jgi:murein DD-endopeptidase MepM/ murein hydrolase activator NlpD
MGDLRPWIVGVVALSLLPMPSAFADERSRRRTIERAGRAADALIGAATGRPGARGAAAVIALREIGSLIRDSARRPSRLPPDWPEETPSRDRGRVTGPLLMPVAGVTWDDLRDSYGDPRSGGRSHRGIDIFAPRWTEVIAVTEGTLTDVAQGGRAGRSLWLVGTDGRSYFYGHLEAWARGVADGLRVEAGEVVGYVGNSGNAAGLPTHLHFEVRDGDRTLNPYPVLADARPVQAQRQTARR